jgi:isocitrate lyase
MKLVKLMVQSGVSGFHIDDLLSGTKRFDRKDGIYYVVVPVSELVRRLTAARLQLDIMGSEAVIIARSDVEMGSHVTSTVDPRDRPYVLGATVALPRDYSSMPTSPEKEKWLEEAKLASLDDAFKAAQPKLFEEFTTKTQGLNVSEALRVANTLAPEFYWSTDAARTIHGWYPYRGCVEAAIDRVLACADVADVLWSCVRGYDGKPAEQFSTAIHKVHPGKWLAYNVTGGFPADGGCSVSVTPT